MIKISARSVCLAVLLSALCVSFEAQANVCDVFVGESALVQNTGTPGLIVRSGLGLGFRFGNHSPESSMSFIRQTRNGQTV